MFGASGGVVSVERMTQNSPSQPAGDAGNSAAVSDGAVVSARESFAVVASHQKRRSRIASPDCVLFLFFIIILLLLFVVVVVVFVIVVFCFCCGKLSLVIPQNEKGGCGARSPRNNEAKPDTLPEPETEPEPESEPEAGSHS